MLYYLVAITVWLVMFFIWRAFWEEMDNVVATYCGNIANPFWYITFIMLICFPFQVLVVSGLAVLIVNS